MFKTRGAVWTMLKKTEQSENYGFPKEQGVKLGEAHFQPGDSAGCHLYNEAAAAKLFGFFNNWSIHSFYWDPQDVLDVENQYQNSAEWKYADNATLAGALGIIMIPALLSKSVEG